MRKITRTELVESDLDWNDIAIKDLRKELDQLEVLGATTISIEGDSYSVDAFCYRLETDKELEIRKAKLNRYEHDFKRRELDQLAYLKEKYESD